MAMGMRCHVAARSQTLALEQMEGDEGEGSPDSPKSPQAGDLQTNTEAITNLLNNCLGSGVLAVALGIRKSGLIAGGIMLVVSCIMNRFSLLLIMDSCKLAGIPLSYSTIGSVALGSA